MRVSGEGMFMERVPVTLTGGSGRQLEGTKPVG